MADLRVDPFLVVQIDREVDPGAAPPKSGCEGDIGEAFLIGGEGEMNLLLLQLGEPLTPLREAGGGTPPLSPG